MTDETQQTDRAGTIQSIREQPTAPAQLRRTSAHISANDDAPFLGTRGGGENNPAVFDVTEPGSVSPSASAAVVQLIDGLTVNRRNRLPIRNRRPKFNDSTKGHFINSLC